jgi:hypothetical protein
MCEDESGRRSHARTADPWTHRSQWPLHRFCHPASQSLSILIQSDATCVFANGNLKMKLLFLFIDEQQDQVLGFSNSLIFP